MIVVEELSRKSYFILSESGERVLQKSYVLNPNEPRRDCVG